VLVWDLNQAERRAVAAAALLVGIAGLARLVGAPPAGETEWQTVSSAVATVSPKAEVAEALIREARAQTPLEPDERIDVARAPAEELRRLPGVGPSLAEAIMRERSVRPFGSVADLERVPGIGPATLRRLSGRVSVSTKSGTGRAPSTGACGETRLDLNAADTARLEGLPGIGPALAARIVEYRKRVGRFASVDLLTEVAGIGERSLARLAPLVCVT
jgi:competence protein ComEA